MEDDTHVQYLSQCIEINSLEKTDNDENLLYPDVKLQQDFSGDVKRGKRVFENSDEEETSRSKRSSYSNRFHWTPSLVGRFIELVKKDVARLTCKNIKKLKVWKEIYLKLLPYCETDGLTVEMVRKKWGNMLDHHRKLLEHGRETGHVRYYEFFEEVDELYKKFQKCDDYIVETKPTNSMQRIIVINPSMTHNGIVVSEGNSSERHCSLPDLNSQLLEESSSGEASENEHNKEEAEKASGKPSQKYRRRRDRSRNSSKIVESSIQELVLEHKKMVHCEEKKARSIEKVCELKEIFNAGILNAINKRTEVLDKQQSSTYRINDILTMLQKYECKLENMDTRLLKLESTMYRIESLLEKVVAKLNEK